MPVINQFKNYPFYILQKEPGYIQLESYTLYLFMYKYLNLFLLDIF